MAARRRNKRKRSPTPRTAFPVDRGRVSRLRSNLLRWFELEGRSFFWRKQGLTPYQALVTEILLTKTRAELVDVTAQQVIARYSTPSALARARRSDLERLLFPLGLHRKRAAGLIACAESIVEKHDGRIPETLDELIDLPSVGRYAANAIACVVHDEAVAVLDANVSRIYQRVFSLPAPPERLASAHQHWATAQRVLPKQNAKLFNWAILDLGGVICTAKAPQCERCPLSTNCDRSGVPIVKKRDRLQLTRK